MTTKEIVDASKPAIVRIEAVHDSGRKAIGTGFVVSSDGRIATNLHVIRGAKSIVVRLLDGTRAPVAAVLGADPKRDLALIRVKAGRKLPTLSLGNSDNISAGDRVIAIGNPLGVLDYTVSDGLISSVRLLSPELTVLQISAPISQGSSGGPLFNNFGQVIGVATMIAREGQNLNFGVPVNYLRPLINAKTRPLAMNEFRAKYRTGGNAPAKPSPGKKPIVRKVVRHPVSVLARCSDQALIAAFQAISKAIRVGAPIYNKGQHEACFRIYEGTALKLEREIDCPGVRDALGQGLLRSSTQPDFTAKAWAMRDAFDGILNVIARKARGQAGQGPQTGPQPGPRPQPGPSNPRTSPGE
jgi:hypothetical protein